MEKLFLLLTQNRCTQSGNKEVKQDYGALVTMGTVSSSVGSISLLMV